MKTMHLLTVFVTYLFCASAAWAQHDQKAPELLTYDEIIQLYQQDLPPAVLSDKLKQLLTTPFVSNRAFRSGVRPLKPGSPQIGKFLRVAEWNIERGLEFDAVKLAFTDPHRFADLMDQNKSTASPEERARIVEQVNILREADLIVFNEVDWGINRTLFRNVAAELAGALRMNYAYGVEFVEVDPVTMGIDQQVVVREVQETYGASAQNKTEMLEHVKQVMTPDPGRYRGLHGTAILSRYSDMKDSEKDDCERDTAYSRDFFCDQIDSRNRKQ